MKTIAVMHMLYVQDMERAIQFYEKALGFKTVQHSGFWSNLECGNGGIALTTYGNKTELRQTTLIIEVDDYQEAVESIKQNGGQIVKIHDPYEGAPVYNVEIIDTENNQLAVSQKVKQ
jgi:predicted enzyme related to lactoylglutathione lyase